VKVNVFGDVAIVTFHGYFEADMEEEHLSLQAQSTLVFAKTGGSWKIIHEHFSPLNPTDED
jgi:ketosteroid isomerase-like protein